MQAKRSRLIWFRRDLFYVFPMPQGIFLRSGSIDCLGVIRLTGWKRHMVWFAAVAVLLTATGWGLSHAAAIPTGSWGIHFQTEGEPPVGNTSQTALSRYDAAFLGDTNQKVLYLTFDAGYENGFTPQILDVLKKHQVPAAFFLVGNYLEREPDLVRRMTEEGHIVGNHTWSHPDMSKIQKKEDFSRELKQVEDQYREITGQDLKRYYRPPQGIYSEENLQMAKELGYRTVFWSLAYVDWNNDAQPTSEEAFSKLLPRTHDGAVILLHSTSQTNAAILDELLIRWKEQGYTFGTLDELFG